MKLEPTNTGILVDRGRTYARMGRSATAKSDFDKALTLDPSNAELRHAIEVEVAALWAKPCISCAKTFSAVATRTTADSREFYRRPLAKNPFASYAACRTKNSFASANDTPPAQSSDGEFARLLKVPASCQIARELGISGRWQSQLASQEAPGPACLAAESCFQALRSQTAAVIDYLTRNRPSIGCAQWAMETVPTTRSQSTELTRLHQSTRHSKHFFDATFTLHLAMRPCCGRKPQELPKYFIGL